MSYTAKKPSLAPPWGWRAAVEAASSASDLALHLRGFDAAVQWDAVRCRPFFPSCLVALTAAAPSQIAVVLLRLHLRSFDAAVQWDAVR